MGFPRELSSLERALLLWVLPADRPGYAEYRRLIDSWKVVGAGTAIEGTCILGDPAHEPDLSLPVPPLFAYGAVNLDQGALAVSVSELAGSQLVFEITGTTGEIPAERMERADRWTYSHWSPSQQCPCCSKRVREIVMRTQHEHELVLAVCAGDHRLWLHDCRTGINHLIPVTGFYNELMLQMRIHDPKIVLTSNRLFSDLGGFSDALLTRAFSSYNNSRQKVILESSLVLESEIKAGWLHRTMQRLTKG